MKKGIIALMIVLIVAPRIALAQVPVYEIQSDDYVGAEVSVGAAYSKFCNPRDYGEDIYSYYIIHEVIVSGTNGTGNLKSYWEFETDITSQEGSNFIIENLSGQKSYILESGTPREKVALRVESGELHLAKVVAWCFDENDNLVAEKHIIFDGGGGDPGDPPQDPPEPPGEIQNVQVESKAGDIIVTWDPDPKADGYKVYINGDPVDVGDTTSYVFTADPGEYEITVTGYNDDGESPQGAPVTVIRPSDPPVVIVNPPACEPPPVLDVNIIGALNPIPIYFPDPPAPPSAPAVNPFPNPDNFVPDADDFDMEPKMPSYDPNHYDPLRDGAIFEYTPPPLDIPEPIESPGPLPSIPDPIIMAHDDPIQKDTPKLIETPVTSEIPVNPQNPSIPEEPRQTDPVNIELPKEIDPVTVEPPRAIDPVYVEPPRELDPVIIDPPIERTWYMPEPPRTMDPPK